ncbi:hypothetical protein GCM10027046_03190 [Uliginosibacterium flavum]|uniref:DUF3096 domain-containing protein n=1 Tax=Uliginosibacterium flavum TaxID=1396831 RepID=A0ABV2TKM7_9RHOO
MNDGLLGGVSALIVAARTKLTKGIGDSIMNMHLALAPVVSLLAGILILSVPRMLNYIVAIYLILIGLIGIFGAGRF